MAVQAHLYSKNHQMGLQTICGLQDWTLQQQQNVPSLNFVDNDICFTTQQLQNPSQQQTQFLLNHEIPNFNFDSNQGICSVSNCNCCTCTPQHISFSQALNAQLELQTQELECFLQLQNEKLRFAMQEQRKRQLTILLSSFETKTLNLIRQKDEDLARTSKKAMELQERLRKVEMENETWQKLAQTNEALVIDLNNTLEQVRRERQILVCNGAEDAESCFVGSCERDVDQEEEQLVEEEKVKKLVCKRCNVQRSCILFLPCRHLCSCKSCEAFLPSCPICQSNKEANMEVFLV